jgi:hypothetical protein
VSREVLVPSDLRLDLLHQVIQADMRDWIGDDWEPSLPDVEAIDLKLASVCARWKRTAPKGRSRQSNAPPK